MHVILAAVLPVLLTVLIGYALARTGKPFDAPTIAYLVGTVGTPVLVFSNLAAMPAIPPEMATLAYVTVIAIASYLAVGTLVLTLTGQPLRSFLPAVSLPNTGNLGLPLALYAFGKAGLTYAIVIFAIHSVTNFTVGQTIAAGRHRWRAALVSPVVPAALLGVAAAEFQVPMPLWIHNTLDILSGLTIPLMLLMLGTSLARIKVTTVGRAFLLALLRLGMGLTAGFLLSAAFGLTGTVRAVFILQTSMPVAVYNYLFAHIYGNTPEDVASLVVVSTVMAVVTVPILLAVLTGAPGFAFMP